MEETFEGFTFGHTWNGWACPYFSLEESMKIMVALNNAEPCDGQQVLNLKAGVFFLVDIDGDYSEDIQPQKIMTEDGEKELYPIGSHCYCWWDEAWNEEGGEE